MKNLFEFINTFGIIVDESTPAIGAGLGIKTVKAINNAPNPFYSEDSSNSSPSSSPISEVKDNKDMGLNPQVDTNVSGGTSNVTSESAEEQSPTDFDGGFIHSILEDSEIPLIILVNSVHILNYLEFSLILSLFSLLFRKYFMKKLQIFIYKYLFKKVENNKEESVNLNKVFNYLDKYNEYLILYVLIVLIGLKLIHLYISYNLAGDIDKYVALYNIMKHNSLFLLFTIKNNNKFNFNYPQWLNKDIKIKLCSPFTNNKLNKINFIILVQWLLTLIIYYLIFPIILILLFTFTISILLNKLVVVSLLSNIQFTTIFTEIDLSDCMLISKIFLPLSSNKNIKIINSF
uniref:LAGLIDADG endonuclease n=1 Tax=Trametes meyenii TaxID=526243 RepID=UPI003001C79C|nr:LAGLIDADG endonuclease [Trametes meyenii]